MFLLFNSSEIQMEHYINHDSLENELRILESGLIENPSLDSGIDIGYGKI